MSAREGTQSRSLPLLPLRDLVAFPGMRLPLFVGREKSIRTLEVAVKGEGKEIFLVAQRQARANDVQAEDLFEVGAVGRVAAMLRLPDGTRKVVVEARRRGRVACWLEHETYFEAEIEERPESAEPSRALDALVLEVRHAYDTLVERKEPPEDLASTQGIDGAVPRLSRPLSRALSLSLEDRQALLEASVRGRLEQILSHLQAELGIR